MRNEPDRIAETELLAYVDGQLEERRTAEIEAALAANTQDAEKAAHWRTQNEAIHALYGHGGEDPLPDRLNVRRMAAEARQKKNDWQRLAAAAVVFLVLGSGMGWYGRSFLPTGGTSQPWIVAEAVDAHALYASEVVHPVEIGASGKDDLTAWLSRRLDRAIEIPELGRNGYKLVGGRVLPAQTGAAAQIMYEDETGRRVTLYIVSHPPGEETAFRYSKKDRVTAVYWRAEEISCVLVGELPQEDLRTIGMEIYRQIG